MAASSWREAELGKKLNSAIFPGLQGGPLMHVIAAKAVALAGEALKTQFGDYGRQIVRNARVLADELQAAGFDLVSGGTDNHLLLIDLTNRDLTGKGRPKPPWTRPALQSTKIRAARNQVAIRNKRRSPGHAALTTRGWQKTTYEDRGRFYCGKP